MTDINELRRDASAAHVGHMPMELSGSEIIELLDRLEEAEADALEQARMNGMGASREAALMAKLEAAEKERDILRDRLALESQENGALRDSVDRACEERDALRAKIEQMERQEPVAWLHETRPDSGVVTDTVKRVWEEAVVGSLSAYSIPLCIAPGAQPAPSEGSITAGILSGMFLSLDGHDKAQPGYEWRKGWNDAIRQAMDYAQPAPSVPDLLEPLRCACNYIDKLVGVSQQYRAMLASLEAKP